MRKNFSKVCEPMNIKIESTNKVFSAFGGLLHVSKMYKSLNLNRQIDGKLPKLKKLDAQRSKDKFEQLVYTFIAGAQCLDDAETLTKDAIFNIISNGTLYTAKSLGNFLRSFTDYQCKQLNQTLIDFAYQLREKLSLSKKSLTIDLDSTIIPQCGKKMEGVGYAYNGIWGLDCIQAFDEYGFHYWHEVRNGGTYSSQNAELIIHQIYSRLPKTKYFKKTRLYFRGDSAFCNSGVFNACHVKSAGFVIRMKENMYKPIVHQVLNWKSQNPNDKHRVRFYDNRECDIGSTFYTSESCEHSCRVVLIRAVKNNVTKKTGLKEDDYNYHAWITNIGEHEFNNRKLIKFYCGRGQAENYIKFLKEGLDLRHYPCQKLVANKAYGVIGGFAANIMRLLSLRDGLKKAKYAKKYRLKWVYIPCQIIRKARYVVLRFMSHHEKEVTSCLNFIKKLHFGFP